MKDLGEGFNQEAVKKEGEALVRLFEFNYTDDEWLYFTDADIDITYNNHTYSRFPISVDKVTETKEGTLPRLSIKISNVSKYIGGYVEDYDGFRGKKVIIRTCFLSTLNTSDHIIDKLNIDSVNIDALNVTFSCTPIFSILNVTLPYRKFSRNFCMWKFKGDECCYNGPDTVCNKSFSDCKSKGNQSRFGGFPGVPGGKYKTI